MAWKRAFSTLGCAGSPLADVLDRARRGGWDGVELRAAPGEPVHAALSPAERSRVREAFGAAGIEPLSIASYVEIDDPTTSDAAVTSDLLRHVELASDIGAPFVRIFPGGPSTDGAALRRLAAVSGALDDHRDVTVALETHDSHSRGRDVRSLLDAVGSSRIKVVWDVQHPWRAGESVEETMDLLEPFLAYVQITDARSVADPTPAVPGTGVLPLRDVHTILSRRGYEGWVSLEWASYWYPDAPPLDVALDAARLWFSSRS